MNESPLLPSDRYIADLLGLSEEQYRYYIAEVRRRAASGPQPSVVNVIGPDFFLYVAVISSLLSIGFTIAASFFKPRLNGQQPTLRQNQIQGQITNSIRRYAPRTGFDSLQDVAGLGDPIPLVYTKREQIDGNYYGGVRINAPLVWSELLTLDKAQILRALFVIGEGSSGYTIDAANTAIGNNTLGAYLLGGNSNARFSVYYRPNGGRISSSDLVAGSSNDPGALTSSDVFTVLNESGSAAPYFCHSRKPNTQTQFGVYALIGNGLGYRVNPQLRPAVSAQITVDVQSSGDKKSGSASAKGRIVCDQDFVALAQREKFKAKFSGRGALTSNSDTSWIYRLSNTTDALTTFQASGGTVSWAGGKALVTNPFSSIANSTVESWISFGSITSSGNSVSGSVIFATTSATNTINQKSSGNFVHNIGNGTYVIQYYVYFEKSGGQQIPFNHTIDVTVTNPTAISAGSFVVGQQYRITTVGTTDFTLIGAANSTVGTIFTATGAGTGTGQAVLTSANREVDYTNIDVTYTGTFSTNSSHQEPCGDAASAVAGRQKTWDDAILIGELYKIGSALAICTDRSPSDDYFNSDADFEPVSPSKGTAIESTFQVIRSGSSSTISATDSAKDAKSNPPFYTATNYPHLFRIAIANFSTVRECRIIAIGIRSSLGIRITGLCNFRDSLTFTQIDGKACKDKEGQQLNPGDSIAVDVFNSGQMSSSEERYSFFRIRYREAGTSGSYTQLPQCFGIRGITQQNIYNSIRLVMPSQKRWEFQLEPLSGWEIRSGTATGDLELIDSSLTTTRTITSGGVTITFRGVVNSGNTAFIPSASRSSLGPSTFQLASVQRGGSGEIGLGYSDGTSYVDAWGKLAEAFVYEEVRSSAESGPEHEIVYVNEIVPNPSTPQYSNLALLGLSMRSGVEWQQFGQLSVYVLSGLQNTHLFPEILQDLLTNTTYGKGDLISLQQIDTASFNAAKTWCNDRRLFFDGAIVGKTNLRQWAADVAAAHLLFFGESGGKFWLRPAWPGTVATPSAVSFKGIFTAGNIKEGSFSMEFFEPEDRRPIQVSVKYREERLSTNLDNPGLFATEREVLVREASPYGSNTDPIESIDLSDYVTSRSHAVDAAKFIVRMRRIPEHAVKFTTTHEGLVAAIAPGDYIRVAMDVTHYDELRNGAVLADGTLVSTQPFANGTYTVLAWNGTSTTPPSSTTLTVSGGGTTATPTGIIFTLINSTTQTRTYQIERITPVEEGGFSIEAVHMPTDSSNILLLSKGFDTAANWVISD